LPYFPRMSLRLRPKPPQGLPTINAGKSWSEGSSRPATAQLREHVNDEAKAAWRDSYYRWLEWKAWRQ
jgi:hypothetical protein